MRSGLAAAARRARRRAAARQRVSPQGGGMSAPLAPLEPPAPTPRRRSSARARHLLSLQHERGCWKGELETNVTMDAEDLLLREFLGIRGDARDRARPRPGSARSSAPTARWATFYGGPPDLSTTIEAYVALRLAGDPRRGAAHAARRASSCASCGGIERSRVFTRIWLALFGAVVVGRAAGAAARADPAARLVPAQHLRLRLLGAADDRAAHGRGGAPPGRARCRFALDELRTGAPPPRARVARAAGPGASSGSTARCTSTSAARCGRLRRLALRARAEWILRRQEADGCWGGIQPPWVYSLIALHLLGYPLDHPALAQRRSTGSTASRSSASGHAPARGLSVAGLGHRRSR